MSTATSEPLLQRIEAARRAVLGQTELLHREFGRATSLWKKDGSRVTAVDRAISENILRDLHAAFPEDQGFSEELADGSGPWPVTAEFSWVLDPIDGTNNYANGLAHCAIALALLQEGEPIYGVIYDFARKKVIHGGVGHGVWDDDVPVKVRADPPHPQALVGFHSPMEAARYPGHADALVQRFKLRALGSSALHLAYVAAGILDGVVDHNVKIWDIAAAIPLVRAAGGEVQFLLDPPLPLKQFDLEMPRIFLVAGNAEVCRGLRRALNV